MINSTGLLQSVLHHRSSRAMAGFLSVVLAIVSTLLVPSVSYARQNSNLPPPPEILVFPFTNSADSSFDTVATTIAGNVRLQINGLGYYRSTGYSVLNPSIQRALNVENTLSVAELSAPSAPPDRADKIAKLVGTPYFLVGNIDSITTDSDTGTVTVTIDGTFYASDTGAVIKQATVSGVAAPASKTFDPADIMSSAIDSASGKLVGALIGPQFSKPAPSSTIKTSKSSGTKLGTLILLGLAVALALVIINNHGHSSSSPSSSSGGSSSGGGGTSGGGTTTGGGSTGPPAPPS